MTSSEVSGTTVLTRPLEDYPALNPFALDLVRGEAAPRRFVHRIDPAAIRPSESGSAHADLVRELTESNLSWGNDVTSELAQWASGGTVALIAGQQVGFGGGPIYTLAKLASLMALGRRLKERGLRSTLFFWMATEDHDFDEVSRLDLPGRNEVIHLEAPSGAQDRRVVGSRKVPDPLREGLATRLGLPPEGWLEPGITFRDSFARLIASVTAEHPVILVDALLPSLRRTGRDLLARVGSDLDQAERLVESRSRELSDAGYSPQVTPADDGHYSLLFTLDENGVRHPVRSGDEVRSLIDTRPERISTGALIRPLLQDFVFRPAMFVGGPAEVSYYAQLGSLYRWLEVDQPHVALRGHLLMSPERFLASALGRGLQPAEIFDPVEEVILRRETDGVEQVNRRVRRMQEDFGLSLGELREMVVEADASLGRSIDRTARRVGYHFEKLGERGRRALARRDQERFRAFTRLHQTLMPEGVVQDRVISWIGYWAIRGAELMNLMVRQIEPDSDRFRIVGI